MKIELRHQAFDPWLELQHAEIALRDSASGQFGAACIFVGTMRDLNEDVSVKNMFLEHYPEMTQQHLQNIATEAIDKWQLLNLLVIHRVGHIEPNDNIILLAAWSAHRDAAFKACRYLIEELKHRAPFWKKETLSNNSERWVTKNTPS
ncbi:MAG: molybdenum cofactor biosynthesis protein MoaE [Gammaproteobacteria bacterium]|nr:molybdenum cofactor biosynthesis protein MoaE [Gammaproteobacteria bacterium]